MWPNPQFPKDLVTFTEEILHGNQICPWKLVNLIISDKTERWNKS